MFCLFLCWQSCQLLAIINSLFCSPMGRETGVQSQVESYQRLKKRYLMPPCLTLSIIRYASKVKWSNPGNGLHPPLHLSVVAIERGVFGSPSNAVANFTFLMLYSYWCIHTIFNADEFSPLFFAWHISSSMALHDTCSSMVLCIIIFAWHICSSMALHDTCSLHHTYVAWNISMTRMHDTCSLHHTYVLCMTRMFVYGLDTYAWHMFVYGLDTYARLWPWHMFVYGLDTYACRICSLHDTYVRLWPYASSSTFLFVRVSPLSILRMIPSILYGWQLRYLSLS